VGSRSARQCWPAIRPGVVARMPRAIAAWWGGHDLRFSLMATFALRRRHATRRRCAPA
jgi:hypothetical protein